MKKNKRASSTDKNGSIFSKINDFITLNNFLLFLLILGVWFHQVFIVGETVNTLKDNQNRMIHYLKDNVNKVYFLSASGMVVTAKKSKVSYVDERFKSYLANEITDSLIGGNIVISSNYKVVFASPAEIVRKNRRIGHFYKRFIAPQKQTINKYVRTLHRAIIEGKYPEYINVISYKYESFLLRKPSELNGYTTKIEGTLKVGLLVKSWVRDLKEWDTREVPIQINFEVLIDLDKYVNIANPFGVHFEKLEIPIIHKPTGTEIMESRR